MSSRVLLRRITQEARNDPQWLVPTLTGIAGILLMLVWAFRAFSLDSDRATTAIAAESAETHGRLHQVAIIDSRWTPPIENHSPVVKIGWTGQSVAALKILDFEPIVSSLPAAEPQPSETANPFEAVPSFPTPQAEELPVGESRVENAPRSRLEFDVEITRVPRRAPLAETDGTPLFEVEAHSKSVALREGAVSPDRIGPRGQDGWKALDETRDQSLILPAAYEQPADFLAEFPEKPLAPRAFPLAVENSSRHVRLKIEKRQPEAADLHRPVEYELIIENRGTRAIDALQVEDSLAPGMRLLDASPPGVLGGQSVRWQLQGIEPGEERRLSLVVFPTRRGLHEQAARVLSSVRVGSQTEVIAKRLTLDAVPASQTFVGEELPIRFRIKNDGPEPADDVRLLVDLPESLMHPAGAALEYRVDRLAPETERDVTLTVRAKAAGEAVVRARLAGRPDVPEAVSTSVVVQERGAVIERTGPRMAFVGRTVEFRNRVRNFGSQPMSSVTVLEHLPEEIEFVRASHGGRFDPDARTVTWQIDVPEAGSVPLSIAVRPRQAGRFDCRAETHVAGRPEERVTAPLDVRPPQARLRTPPCVCPSGPVRPY